MTPLSTNLIRSADESTVELPLDVGSTVMAMVYGNSERLRSKDSFMAAMSSVTGSLVSKR